MRHMAHFGVCLRFETELGRSCPTLKCKGARIPETGGFVTDAHVQGLIEEQVVRCINNGRGCRFFGEHSQLHDHIQVCQYSVSRCVACDCQVNRSEMERHTFSECIKRTVQCVACLSWHRSDESKAHQSGCSKYPIECPLRCSSNSKIERGILEHHLSTDCPLQVIACPLSDEIGCTVQSQRHLMKSCLENPEHIASHVDKALKRIRDQNSAIKNNTTLINALAHRVDVLELERKGSVATKNIDEMSDADASRPRNVLQPNAVQPVGAASLPALRATDTAVPLVPLVPLPVGSASAISVPLPVGTTNTRSCEIALASGNKSAAVVTTIVARSSTLASGSNAATQSSTQNATQSATPPSARTHRGLFLNKAKPSVGNVRVNDVFDVLDNVSHRWRLAQVVSIGLLNPHLIQIHYLGWAVHWDEVIDLSIFHQCDKHKSSAERVLPGATRSLLSLTDESVDPSHVYDLEMLPFVQLSADDLLNGCYMCCGRRERDSPCQGPRAASP